MKHRYEVDPIANDDLTYNEPYLDRQSVELVARPPFTGGFAGHFSPRKPGKTADYSYDFVFIIDREHLYGYFHAQADKGERFRGLVSGGRGTAGDAAADGPIPCTARCGAHCLGPDAVHACQQACGSDVWAKVPCRAPDPTEEIGLPSKTRECENNTARSYAGKWLFLARDRTSRADRAYEVELGADGCDITVKSAQERGGEALAGSTGRAHATGLWQVTLKSGKKPNQVRHQWSPNSLRSP